MIRIYVCSHIVSLKRKRSADPGEATKRKPHDDDYVHNDDVVEEVQTVVKNLYMYAYYYL